jgi:hypothetical protein
VAARALPTFRSRARLRAPSQKILGSCEHAQARQAKKAAGKPLVVDHAYKLDQIKSTLGVDPAQLAASSELMREENLPRSRPGAKVTVGDVTIELPHLAADCHLMRDLAACVDALMHERYGRRLEQPVVLQNMRGVAMDAFKPLDEFDACGTLVLQVGNPTSDNHDEPAGCWEKVLRSTRPALPRHAALSVAGQLRKCEPESVSVFLALSSAAVSTAFLTSICYSARLEQLDLVGNKVGVRDAPPALTRMHARVRRAWTSPDWRRRSAPCATCSAWTSPTVCKDRGRPRCRC